MRPDIVPGPFSPTTNFPITRRNAGSSRSCKASILWCSSSAAALSAPEGLLELHREMEVGYCRLVTIASKEAVLIEARKRPLRVACDRACE